MKRYVLGFYLTPDGVVLIKKTKPDWQRGKWNGIGGSIEAGETPLQAMVREFAEEAQLLTTYRQWTQLFTLSGLTFGAKQKPWQMTVFMGITDGEVKSHFPLTGDEGSVDVLKTIPSPMDSTAAWLLPMCWDLCRHGMAVGVVDTNAVIANFCERVKVRAESNIEANGTVSGAHWNAMRVVAKEMGIEVEL